jgi:hypothetical protein
MLTRKWKLSVATIVMSIVFSATGLGYVFPGWLQENNALVTTRTAAAEEYIMNEPLRVILTAKTLDAADAFDVIVSVMFTGPGGQTYEIPGKHLSGNQWLFHFQPPVTGSWSYVSSCQSHPSDTGLHGVSGIVVKSAETKQPTVYLATDYVDKNLADTTSDMRRLFREASTHANTTGNPVEVRLEAGANYRLGSQGSESAPIIVSNVKNMVINGQGATFTGLNLQSGLLRITGCENVIVKDLYFDYDPLPYSYGTVTHIDGNIFHFKIDEGFIEFDYPAYTLAVTRNGTWGVKLSYENGVKIYGQPVAGSTTFVPLGNREWKLDTSTMRHGSMGSLGVKVNDKFVILCRNYAQAMGVINSKNTVLENLVIYTSPGLAYYPSNVESFVMRDCHVRVKGDRPISTNADGIHMRGSRGNVVIEGCTFEGMLDDGINIHSSAMSVLQKIADNKYNLSKGVTTVRVGDRLQAVEQGTSRIIGIFTVTEVTTGGVHTVTFDRNVNLKTGTGFTNADNLYNLDESASSFVIKDCVFNAYRGRGVLLSSQNGLVYDNTFNIQGSPCIHFVYETQYWGEGPFGRNIVIRNNTFNRVRSSSPPIVSNVQSSAGGAPLAAYENIFIRNNIFVGFGISATGVINMSNTVPGTPVLEGNVFTMYPATTATPGPTSPPISSTPSSSPTSSPQNTVTPSVTQPPQASLSPGSSDVSEDISQDESGDPSVSSDETSETSQPLSETSDESASHTDDPDKKSGGFFSTLLLIVEVIVILALLAGGGVYFIKIRKGKSSGKES